MVIDGAFERDLTELEQHCRERLNFGDFVKNASLGALEALVAHCERFPEVGAIIDHFHGFDVIHDAIKTAGMRERTRSILDQPRPQHSTGSLLKEAALKQKIKIISYEASRVEGVPKGLTEEDQEKLLKEKVLINDDRDDDEVSIPYNVQTEMRLFNPTETGLYWMLTKPGDFEKCLVVIHPHGPNGRKQFCTVIRISDEKNWLNIHPSEVWASGRIEGKEYDEWYEGLTEAGSLETGKSRYVLVGPRGNGTLPFKVTKSLGEAEGTKSYEVDFSTYCENNGHRNSGLYGYRPYESDPYAYNEWQDGQRIHIDAKDGTDLRSLRGDLYVPKGYKKITAKMSGSDATSDGGPCCVGSSSGSETPPIRPGNLVDAELAIQIKTAGLKLIHDGTEVFINSDPPISPLGALVHLVKDHGFRENVARHMLKQAEAKRTFRVRVKYANPYLSQGGPSAPSFPEPSYEGYNMMGADVPSMAPQEQTQQIPEMSASNTDRSVYDPRASATPAALDQQAIQQAVSTGQKEVFDTAMIGSMLKAKRDDTLVDKYLPDMIKGMDRKGRVLLQLYANGDKFAERYGKQDLPELEDGLRNAFEADGDCFMFLKQKTDQPFPEQADAVNHDLDESS